MSVASNSGFKPTPSFPPLPPSFSSHASPPSLRPLSGASASSAGPIPLRREDFPLLHTLLESPAYQEALKRNPELARRPTARHSSEQKRKGSSSKHGSKGKPPKSSSAALNDLWSRVPKSRGAASSIAGGEGRSRTSTAKRTSGDKWKLVQPDHVETIQDGLPGFSPPVLPKRETSAAPSAPPATTSLARQDSQRAHAHLFSSAVFDTPSIASAPPALLQKSRLPAVHNRQLPPLPSASAPSTGDTAAPTFPPTDTPRAPLPVPPKPSTPPPQLSSVTYASRTYPPAGIHVSNSTLQLREPPERPTTGFQSAVSQLKRMLSRSSRKPRRGSKASKSRSSLGAGSTFSSSTGFDDARSGYSPSSPFVDLGADIEELVGSPMSYEPTPFSSRRTTSGPSHPPLSSAMLASSGPPAVPPTEYGSLPPSFQSPLSFSARPSAGHPPRRSSLPTSPAPASAATRRSSASTTSFEPRSAGGLLAAAREAAASREARTNFLQLLRDGPDAVIASTRGSPALSVRAKQGLATTVVAQAGGNGFTAAALPAKKTGGALRWTSSLPALRRRPTAGKGRKTQRDRLVEEEQRSRSSIASSGMSGSRGALFRSSGLAALPPLERAQTLEDTVGGGWLVEQPAGRPASTYSSYGSRWVHGEGVLVSAPSAYSGRASVATHPTGGDEDSKVWRKWRSWVRERRQSVQGG